MTRLAVVALSCLSMLGCATYTQDLERARRHYQNLEFPQSLAVLRVLGEDYDGLSPAERIQFSYLRGMTDFRLSETVPAKGPLRGQLRACAKDWLDECFALEKGARAGLSPDQAARARVALAQLIDVEAPAKACLIGRSRP